ncbi:hypothetical protein LRS03_03110 [Rhizobacter sp. J219]|jgi:hypothetical protein|uniref:hypothetical protein n=1 Tax=Rhizobacter sp. J219 TaxID=2898430 RepID=UPI0021507532|nr:hypothetical protein [Rhizobacter sp. J219]MCR5881901.1 hypothetical protein [Rhizobacter sp. J219]
MTSVQEFAHIARQLEWLEGHLRAQAVLPEARMAEALGALACARAVVVELAQIGNTEPVPLEAGD